MPCLEALSRLPGALTVTCSSRFSRAVTLILILLLSLMIACGGGGNVGGGNTQPPANQNPSNPTPVVSGVSPTSSVAGSGSTQVTVTGSGFVSTSSVQWNGTARSTTFVSSTELQVTLTAADLANAGSGQISVVNPAPGGGTSSNTAFAINNPAPAVTSANPSAILAGSNGSSITVTGTGFVSQSVVQWNGSARTTTYVSATQLQVALVAADLAAAGTAQISIVNPAPGGGTSSNLAFTVNNPAPAITSANPATVSAGSGASITITGSGFVPQSVAQWNGTSRTTTYVSSTQLQVTLSASDLSASGTGSLTVVNSPPGGGSSGGTSITITYAAPTLASLFPNSAVMGSQAVAMNVGGAGFAPASVVKWNGTALQTTYLSGSVLSAVIPAADLITNGTAQVTVVNPTPGGGTSSPATFTITTYPVPVLFSITPTSVYVNSGTQTITVNGTALQAVSVVQVNGTTVPTTPSYCWYSSDICGLTATVDGSYLTSSGSLTITVYTPPPSGGVSNSATLTVSAPPAPTLNSISPTAAPIGSSDLTVTVYGSNFSPTSVVQWNGSPLSTTFSNSGSLTAIVPKIDLATFELAQVSVSTPAPGGGTSTSVPFSTYLPLPANDLVYSSATQLLYASVPSSGGPTLGNSVVSIDPNTGVLGTPIWLGSEPNRLALSADGLTLWVGLDGASSVRKVDLNTGTAGIQFYLGGGNGIYSPSYTAKSISVMPGSPNTIAVANSVGIVTIYDSGIARANSTGSATSYNSGGIAFGDTGAVLYEVGSGYSSMQVNGTGIASSTVLNPNVNSSDLRYDNGFSYLTTGVILNAATGIQQGVFSVSSNQTANGPVAPDSTIGRTFVLVNPNYYFNYQVNVYDLSSFVLLGSIPVQFGPNPYPPTPSRLVRWGQDGLAIPYGSQIYILRSMLVRDLSSTLADVAISVTAPSSAATGADVTYNVTVSNSGPSTANPVTLLDFLPDGMAFKSVNVSQGSCTGGMVVRCSLGSLANSGTATLQITATALVSGKLTNTASVSAAQGDSNTGNNTANTDVTVSGNAYSTVPALYSISPAIAQAGASSFMITVNGDNFSSASTINWNGSALATAFVNSSQLTAQIDSSKIASLGWAWVNVNTPAPGGGNSPSLPFTTYQAVNVSTNNIVFDPFTRKIYGSVPSTATQVTGNSLVAIDPFAGTVGTPIPVGSEPSSLVESDDGKYLYVGLNGAESITSLDLTTMNQGSVYPITVTSYGQTPTIRDLAVMTGNDNTLAVDTGSYSGIGVLDINGTTATMRSTLTGTYTGSSLAFANASTVYSFNSDTWQTFDRWTLGSTGLTKIDSTTLNGMGPFFQLVKGRVYGAGGAVADPSTTPPSLLGANAVSTSVSTSGAQITGVDVDPAASRAFYSGSTYGGSDSAFLAVFDLSHYLPLQILQFPGSSLTGTDLLRWGSDGLAWQMAPWPSYLGGSSQVILMRGPLVQPYLGVANPIPGITSASPANTTHGIGNLILTVTGTSFAPGATVSWNGNERTTTYTDSTHLKVAIPASDLASAGSATLKVKNPGTSSSAGITFTIN